jgi:hexosaminidase
MTNINLVPYPKEVIIGEGVYRGKGLPNKQVTKDYGEEGYCIKITVSEIQLIGDTKGLYYASRTLQQLRIQFEEQLPCMEIVDEPTFSYRGFMLDSSRHFIEKCDVLKLIDAAAYFKLNKMHWHLTDDQGWRIQIDAYPNLTKIGAKRGKVHFGKIEEPDSSEGFYSKEDIREIVAYATEHMIDIIPEFEIPGHESAMLAAYPEFGCGGEKVEVQTRGGIFDQLICVGREESWLFITNVLDEMIELFPYEYIHIGGDEACKRKWRSCPDCQKKMRELAVHDENALQQRMVTKVKEYLRKCGKTTVVWNDSLRGGNLDSDFIVQAWMGDKKLVTDFIERGGRMIQSDNRYYYLDYPYFMIDAAKILENNPYPDYLDKKLHHAVLGLECPLWTERVPDLKTAATLMFPRLPAMAECAWTVQESRDNVSFFDRYAGLSVYLTERGLYGAPQEYWRITDEVAKQDEEQYKKVIETPENIKGWEIDGKLMEEERRIYGDENEE